jgi:hypothetical protein
MRLITALFAVLSATLPAAADSCSTYHTAWGDMVKCDSGASSWSSTTPYGTATTVKPGHTAPELHCWTGAPSPYAGGQTTTCR